MTVGRYRRSFSIFMFFGIVCRRLPPSPVEALTPSIGITFAGISSTYAPGEEYSMASVGKHHPIDITAEMTDNLKTIVALPGRTAATQTTSALYLHLRLDGRPEESAKPLRGPPRRIAIIIRIQFEPVV